MKLIRQLEDRRIEETFIKGRCKQCQGPLGDQAHQMPRHPELPDYCQHCGADTLDDMPQPDDHYVGEGFAKKTYRNRGHYSTTKSEPLPTYNINDSGQLDHSRLLKWLPDALKELEQHQYNDVNEAYRSGSTRAVDALADILGAFWPETAIGDWDGITIEAMVGDIEFFVDDIKPYLDSDSVFL